MKLLHVCAHKNLLSLHTRISGDSISIIYSNTSLKITGLQEMWSVSADQGVVCWNGMLRMETQDRSHTRSGSTVAGDISPPHRP